MWLTNKETGGKFNTDWINEEESKKQKQIANNKKQADKLNNKMPSKFEEHAEEYVAGGIDVDRVFDKEDLKYIENHSTETGMRLFRVEESKYTLQDINSGKLDSNNFKFAGSYRSFSSDFNVMNRALDEDSDEWAGMRNPVIYQTMGHTKSFNMEPYTKEYAKQFGSQSEHLVGGNFKIIKKSKVKIAGKMVPLIIISQEK